ncbi:hemolysin family protein [Neobacillus ginsengisoli]|uniref:CBS domain containing-hemolysin-like protein n=1 Tax=Neobacillus ginsengisoli TaxID=904295 RepID=A0ABT9XRP9_9BACI|nr:hemolysin family protein [Neobacillus ginsengisoli]MDQ0198073.1 CBS domain containing-hemolysin-like protein [Neobacillus ginsengisoli]
MIGMNIALIAILIAFTAFFVSSEFAMIKVRTTRIDQLLSEGNEKAEAAKKVLSNLDGYLSATQVGITITSLILGWLGEPTIRKLLEPIFDGILLPSSLKQIVSFIAAFLIITFFNVVIGELSPKTFAIQKAEEIMLLFAPALILFYRVMYPFIWALNRSARFVTGLFGIKPASEQDIVLSEEELRMILSQSYESGEINQSEYRYVNRIFEFDNRIAKEIMVPRTELVTLSKDATMDEIIEVVKEEKYTRYPVIDGDKDNIYGIVNIKEILTDCIQDRCVEKGPLMPYLKPVIHVIETIPIHELLVKLQKSQSHMAVLSDEYGGTAGIVTVEDILEEIVGEIRDEFDMDELPLIQKKGEGHFILDGKVLISEVNDLLGTTLEEEDVDTIGGWFLTQKFDVHKGDAIEKDGFQFQITENEGHHILYMEVKKLSTSPE